MTIVDTASAYRCWCRGGSQPDGAIGQTAFQPPLENSLMSTKRTPNIVRVAGATDPGSGDRAGDRTWPMPLRLRTGTARHARQPRLSAIATGAARFTRRVAASIRPPGIAAPTNTRPPPRVHDVGL